MASKSKEDEKSICDVKGCSEEAARSISSKKAAKAGLSVKEKTRGNVHLCKDHYRDYKKATREDRKLERLGR